MRRWFTGILAVTLAVVAVRAASAKGTADRILVTGPGIDGALAVTDRAITSLLSVGALEDFMAGAVEPPADLSGGYALQRQFAAGTGAYQTFDRVAYHPDPEGGRGYIYYEGIENGWSESTRSGSAPRGRATRPCAGCSPAWSRTLS
ncbi:MAG: hypothetical protein M5R40_15750 [Anaerolineae bacterium]|nr:hypothetical protein [Anaerolineae bacterium]